MKKILIVFGALFGLLLLAGVAIVLFFDINAYKPRIERAGSDALGMEFRILGKAGLRLLPPAGVSLADIRLRNRGSEIAKVGTVRVGVALRPLLRRRLVITDLVLVDPFLRVEKGADGKFNFETSRPRKPAGAEEKAGIPVALSVDKGELRNGAFLYLNRAEGGKAEISGIELSVTGFSLPSDPDVPLAKGVRFRGELKAKEVKTTAAVLRDVKGTVAASGGVYEIRPLSMKAFGGTGEGGLRVDLSKREPLLRVNYALKGFRAEESLAAVSREKRLSGALDLSLDLSLQGNNAPRMKRTLGGKASLRGEGLTAHGLDIDGALSTVSAARGMNLADLGAFMLAPLGSAAKGLLPGGAGGSAGAGKETAVTKLVSDWTVREGIADAQDVAFATRRTRVALKGKLDLVNQRFVDVTVAALDAKGCARIRQKVQGPFRKPRMDKTSALESAVLGPVLDLFGRRAKALAGRAGECEPFYAGSVAHPG